MSDPTATRRWFRFGHRTTLMATALLAIVIAWVGNARRLANERQAMRALIVARGGEVRSGPTGIKHFGWAVDGELKPMLPLGNWRRQVFDYVAELDVPNSFNANEKARIRVLFPDATLYREAPHPVHPVNRVAPGDAPR